MGGYFIFAMRIPVQDRQPDHGLGLLLHPAQEVQRLDELVSPRLLEAGPHTRLHVGAAKGLDLAQHPRNLDKYIWFQYFILKSLSIPLLTWIQSLRRSASFLWLDFLA